MHSNRLRVEQADAGLSNTRATELRAYLDQLIDTLDDTSLRAVLKLMISETRGAVCKQQQLIALERLAGREAGGRMQRLHELETVHTQLTAVYASHVASEDDGTDDERLGDSEAQMSRVEAPAHASSTRTATPSSVHAFRRLGTIRKEPGDYGGRLSAAALEGELARAEPAPVRDRQGRHGAGSTR